MGKIIPKQTIEQVRDANDIVDVIGSYIQLKRAGTAHKALCPFHKEKTPSFNVNQHRQIYHCFGCGAGGDVFRFVMEYEGIDFGMAVRMLADRAGIQLEFEEGSGPDRSEKEVLYRIHEEAASFFHRALMQMPEAETARKYLADRAISGETIEAFLIGYAPERKSTMREFGKKKGFSTEELAKAGLMAIPERGTPYDRFRKRVMIPIRDQLGRVIAFTGRVLDASQPGGKYVNSPETALFHKSRVLFALDMARRSIVDQREAIICEGQIDAIRCHEAGIDTVVASQGTALTEEHARLLKRYADSVVFVLDPDEAGQNAALRSAEHFLRAELGLHVVALPEGEDPDTLIRDKGPEAFRKLVDGAVSIIEFAIDVMGRREDLQSEAGLMRTVQTVLDLVHCVPSSVRRDQYLAIAADRLGLREDALRRDLSRKRKPARRAPEEETHQPAATVRRPPEELALLETLCAHPETVSLVEQYLPLSEMADDACRALAEQLLDNSGDETFSLAVAVSDNDELTRLAARVQVEPRNVTDGGLTPEQAVQKIILVIRRKHLERRRDEITRQIDTAEDGEREELRRDRARLVLDISRFRQGWDAALPILEL
jgi:DNA primase